MYFEWTFLLVTKWLWFHCIDQSTYVFEWNLRGKLVPDQQTLLTEAWILYLLPYIKPLVDHLVNKHHIEKENDNTTHKSKADTTQTIHQAMCLWVFKLSRHTDCKTSRSKHGPLLRNSCLQSLPCCYKIPDAWSSHFSQLNTEQWSQQTCDHFIKSISKEWAVNLCVTTW